MFQRQLIQLVEKANGSIAALLVGFDGISVDYHTKSVGKLDLLLLASECTYLINQARKSSRMLTLGPIKEVSFQTPLWNVLLQIVDQNYFLILVMTKTGLLAKGRFFLDLTALQLQGDIEHGISNQS